MREWLFLVLGLLAAEAVELSPHLMKKLVQRVSRGLPEEHREIMEETWLGELDALPGKLSKLGYILPLLANRQEVLQAIREAEGRSPYDTRTARLIARAFTLTWLVLCAPWWLLLMLVVSILIWLEDKHHPMFVTTRVGLNGKRISVFKFRTFHPDSERVLMLALQSDADLRAEWEAGLRLKRDPRVTRVGAYLRRTGLEALPMIVNLWRGDIVLVGPRPLPSYFHEGLPEEVQRQRLLVPPGLVSPDGLTMNFEEEQRYVRNWSIWLDLKLVAAAMRAVLAGFR